MAYIQLCELRKREYWTDIARVKPMTGIHLNASFRR
jgi:hypothetical protein